MVRGCATNQTSDSERKSVMKKLFLILTLVFIASVAPAAVLKLKKLPVGDVSVARVLVNAVSPLAA